MARYESWVMGRPSRCTCRDSARFPGWCAWPGDGAPASSSGPPPGAESRSGCATVESRSRCCDLRLTAMAVSAGGTRLPVQADQPLLFVCRHRHALDALKHELRSVTERQDHFITVHGELVRGRIVGPRMHVSRELGHVGTRRDLITTDFVPAGIRYERVVGGGRLGVRRKPKPAARRSGSPAV